MFDMTEIGRWIAAYRKEKGMTQMALFPFLERETLAHLLKTHLENED